MKAKATQSFAQDRGTVATPAAGAKAEAIRGTFITSDATPWKPVDPENHPGLEMFAVWGNPNEGASLLLQKFPAGMDSGRHWHTAAYQGVVIQGKFTHTFEGAAPQTGGPGSVWSQPARQVHDDKCVRGGRRLHHRRVFPRQARLQAGGDGGAIGTDTPVTLYTRTYDSLNLLATWIPALGIALLGVLKLTGTPRVAEEMSKLGIGRYL